MPCNRCGSYKCFNEQCDPFNWPQTREPKKTSLRPDLLELQDRPVQNGILVSKDELEQMVLRIRDLEKFVKWCNWKIIPPFTDYEGFRDELQKLGKEWY